MMSGGSERKWTTLRKIANPEEDDDAVSGSESEGSAVGKEASPDSLEVVEESEEAPALEPAPKANKPLVQKHTVVISSSPADESDEEPPELPPLPVVELEEEETIVERTWFAPSSASPGSLDEDAENFTDEDAAPAIVVPLEQEDESFAPPSIPAPVYVSLHSGFSEKQDSQESTDSAEDRENRVLVAHTVPSTTRLIRETLSDFTEAQVDTTSDPIRAFELALQKRYRLFYFPIQLSELSGPMLYELICKAYSSGHGPATLAPGVIFIREKEDPQLPIELARDARVKDTISKPIRIERLLQSVEGVLEVKDPTGR